MKQIIQISFILGTTLLFTACGTNATPEIARSADFKVGQKEGCTTASGEYTKNSTLFNENKEYRNGWFYGRKHCNPSLSKK